MPTKTARRDAGSGGLYQDARGLWTVALELPPDPATGKRRRKVVRRRTKAAAVEAMRAARRDLDRTGDLPTSSPTVAQWLELWLRTVSAKRVRPGTQVNRANDVRLHIAPVIGRVRLDKLTADHVRKMHDAIVEKGNSSTTALRCHRLLHVALRDAMRAGRVTKNVAGPEFVDAPRAAVHEQAVLTPAQAITLLQAASTDPHGARWAMSLLTGARRGEVLGLEADRVDWQAGTITLSWQLQRLRWEHGCAKDGRPPVCGGTRGSDCPARRFAIPAGFEARQLHGGLHLVRPKTRAGWRVVPLVEPFASILQRHQAARPSDGLVFLDDDGRPIDPRDDGARWRELLRTAGIDHLRQHAARHTAATLLLACGVDQRVVMQILGHSSAAMSQHYQHVDLTMARDALGRLGALLTPAARDTPSDTPGAPGEIGRIASTGVTRP